MNKIQILGTGCCGFLRAWDMFKSHIDLKFKGGKRKYQNAFQVWEQSMDLIWESESLTTEERKFRIKCQDSSNNISHVTIKWIPDFLDTDPSIKFLCLKGDLEFTIKCLLASWGFRNPCFVKERGLGIGKNRYPVDQFPNLSLSDNELEATKIYVEQYYKLAEHFEKSYPESFKIVDSERFFSEQNYQKEILSFFNLDIPFYYNPVNKKTFHVSTVLHGGLGNNLFQIAEVISFCEKYSLGDPFFGTWDLINNTKFPKYYDCDYFLGGHHGSQSDMKNTFVNLDWREDLISDYDVKFSINDMFNFSSVYPDQKVRETFSIKRIDGKNLCCLHLRFCTLSADTHVKKSISDDFYLKILRENIPDSVKVLVFSDNTSLANKKIEWFRSNFKQEFELVDIDAFRSLEIMANCEYNIMNVSTFSFWGAYLLSNEIDKKIFCPNLFIDAHGPNMIHPSWGWNIL